MSLAVASALGHRCSAAKASRPVPVPMSAMLRTTSPRAFIWLSMARQPDSGGMLAGAEGLARRDDEILEAGLVQRRMVGRADMEAAGADRLDALLAQRHPVGLGQLLDGEVRRRAREQRFQRRPVARGGPARQPRFEPPVIGPV